MFSNIWKNLSFFLFYKKNTKIRKILCFSPTGTHFEEFHDMDDEMDEENIDDEDDEKVSSLLLLV